MKKRRLGRLDDAPGQILLFDAERRCPRCHRVLRGDASVRRGLGPTCARIMQAELRAVATKRTRARKRPCRRKQPGETDTAHALRLLREADADAVAKGRRRKAT